MCACCFLQMTVYSYTIDTEYLLIYDITIQRHLIYPVTFSNLLLGNYLVCVDVGDIITYPFKRCRNVNLRLQRRTLNLC